MEETVMSRMMGLKTEKAQEMLYGEQGQGRASFTLNSFQEFRLIFHADSDRRTRAFVHSAN